MVNIEAILILGAIQGAALALTALGFTLIYGVAGVVNFSHGSLFMLGAYIFFTFLDPNGVFQLNLFLALLLAVIVVAVISIIFYRLAIHPVIDEAIAGLVVTVASAIVFERLILLWYGPSPKSVLPLISGSTYILDVVVSNSRLLAFGISLLFFVGLWIFLRKAKVGKAMRAVAQDRETAMLMGINTGRVQMLTMAISGGIAAAAGILVTGSVTYQAASYMWMEPLTLAFAIVVLGGLGSIKGSLIGGFIIAYTGIFFQDLYPAQGYLQGTVSLAIMILILLIRPKGLFGKRIELEE